MKRFLLILALWLSIVAGAVAQTAKPNILIITGSGTIEKEIADKMEAELSDRYNITRHSTGSIALDGFSQIYDLRININDHDYPQAWQREAFLKFLNAAKGNSLFLLGGPMSNYNLRGVRINSFITEAGGGPVKNIQNDNPGDPEILKAPFASGPNSLTTISLGEKGGTPPLSGTGTYLSTHSDGTPGCGLYFAQNTLTNAPNGCLVVLYSFALMRDNDALRANIEHVMAAGGTLPGPTASSISLSVTPNPTARSSKVTYTATVTPGATGSVMFKRGNAENLVSLNSNGTATYVGNTLPYAGTISMTAQYYGDANYNPSGKETVNVVVCGTPMYPTGVTATAGDGQATVSFTPPTSDGGAPIISYTVTASPGNITATGTSSPITITGLTNGTAYTFKVKASNGPNTSMDSPSSNSVTPMHTSVVTYPTEAPYGTAIGEGALSATADVPGTFDYTPAKGTMLNVGNNQALSVTFTPTDKGNTTASKAVTVNVTKAQLTVTASSHIITKGEPIPTPNITYSGFVNGEDESVLDIKPTATTIATNTSNAGTYDIVAANGSDDNYELAYVKGTLTISKITPTITWAEPATITYGTPVSDMQFNATVMHNGAAVPGTLTYTTEGKTLKAGDILAAGDHILKVTFTPTDAVNYSSVEKTVSLTVEKATPTITWEAPSAITYGTPVSNVQLSANVSFNGATVAGATSYTDNGNAVKEGDILIAGEHILKATFTPTDAANYISIEKTVSLTVEKATPTITWETPSSITYGTPVSNVQLSANVSFNGAAVVGATSYTDNGDAVKEGDILIAGEHILKATFTPTDAANYISIEKTVSLTVEKATPTITWEAPSTITYGTKLDDEQLRATADAEGTFTYTPATGTVLNAGLDQTLSATFTPTDKVNYNEVTKTVAITVGKVPLTATATSYSIREGEAIPALGVTYKGFVNGDTEAVLDTKPTATTTATATSPTGVYDITVAGGADDSYEFAYVAGKLTISNPIVVNALKAPQPACEGDKLSLAYTLTSGRPTEYQIVFDAKALTAGFSNSGYAALPTDDGTVSFSIPARVTDGTYQATLQLRDGYGNISEPAAFQVTVNVSADVIVPKFGSVVLIDNHDGRFTGYQWYKNGSAIGGATSQFYKDPNGLSGTYYAQLKTATGQTVNTCSKALSIKKSAQASVSVYPNPARAGQELTVKLSGFADEELQGAVLTVYSTQGVPVLTSRKVEQENRITLSGTDGVYMGRIATADGQVLTFKVVLAN